jgi:TPR repeat protein
MQRSLSLLLLVSGVAFGCATTKDAGSAPKTPNDPFEADPDQLPGYMTGCDADDGVACGRLARLHHLGRGVEKDLKSAERLYQKACDLEYALACRQLAVEVRSGKLGGAEDVERALALAERACQLGPPLGCGFAASRLKRSGDIARSIELRRRGCDHGDRFDCTLVGEALRSGSGVAKDAAQALSVFTGACEQGDHVACFYAGEMHLWGEAGERDLAAAEALAVESCEEGALNVSCALLGDVRREQGRTDEAASLYESSCRDNALNGCLGRGQLAAARGEDPQPWYDERRAKSQEFCEIGMPSFCTLLADELLAGELFTKDEAKAAELYSRACELGERDACERASELAASGEPERAPASTE